MDRTDPFRIKGNGTAGGSQGDVIGFGQKPLNAKPGKTNAPIISESFMQLTTDISEGLNCNERLFT